MLWVYKHLGVGPFGWVVNGLLLVLTALVFRLLTRQVSGARLVAAGLPLLATALLAASLDKAVERIHFCQYALFGLLLYQAMDHPTGKRLAWAFGIAAMAGLLDEVIQFFLPNRYWDPRDVAMNAIGGGLGLWLARFPHPGPDGPFHSESAG